MKNSTHKSGAWRSFACNRHILSTNIIMRIQLLFLIMLIAAMHAFGSAKGQSVTLSAKKTPLVKVFDQIETQTGYYFNYKTETVDDLTVTIELQNVTLQQALDACFKNLPITYKISERVIVVKRKPQQNGQEAPEAAPIPPVTITGTITNEKGEPFPGVTVRVKGSKVGTVTDKDGKYSIIADRGAVLVFTYVGYQPNVATITSGQTEISFSLIENPNQLKETVVKGYYTTTKELNTGNVSTIKSEIISQQPVTDLMGGLISRVPGLNIQQTSGVQGRRFNIRLRGQNSLENGNDPLIIVDGIQYNSTPLNSGSNSTFTSGGFASPFSYLNPADIESVEILKDADATAIYGSRGANGVILITSKKSSEGKLSLDARFYSGISEAPLRLKFMEAKQYLRMRHEAFENDRTSPTSSDFDLNGTWDTTRSTDWQNFFIGNTAPVNDATMSVNMGNSTSSFRLGGGFRSEGTIYPSNFRSNRGGVNFSANHFGINRRLRLSFSGSYGISGNSLPVNDVEQYITLAPVAPNIYNNDGSLNWANSTWENPMGGFQSSASEKAKALISNLSVSYNVLDGLFIKASLGYTSTDFKQRNLTPFTAFNPEAGFPANLMRSHSIITNSINSFVVEPQLTYSTAILGFKVDATAGATIQKNSGEYLAYSANGFTSDAIIQNLAAATSIYDLARSNTEYKYGSVFARTGLSFQSKYVLNLTARRDVSSRFGPGRKAGNFGAVGAAWIFSNEDFLKSVSQILSFGKLRFSYGTTGNDQIGEYKYLETYSVYNLSYQGNTSFTPTQLTNPFYSWERVNKIELGLELGFFDGRVSTITSFYRNRTKNQLVQVPLPFTTGFDKVRANLPATIQNSGFELELTALPIKKRNFTWTTQLNLTIPRNKLISFPGLSSSSYTRRFVVGQPINSLAFLYKYTGKDERTGLFKYDDVNGDGTISSLFDYQPIFIGQNCYGGFYNSIKFGRFMVDLQLQYTKQNGYSYLYTGSAGAFSTGKSNQLAQIDELQHQPFTAGNITQILNGGLFNSSTGIISDASFLRLKNLSINYLLPINRKKSSESCRLFIQGQNLATISNYIGYDPESPSNGIVIPPLRMIVGGIQLNF